MDPGTEGHMGQAVAVYVKAVRIRETPRIAVGRTDEEQDCAARGDGLSMELRIARDQASDMGAGRLKSQLATIRDPWGRMPMGAYQVEDMKGQRDKRVEEIIERAAEAMGGPRKYQDLQGTVQENRIRISVSGMLIAKNSKVATMYDV